MIVEGMESPARIVSAITEEKKIMQRRFLFSSRIIKCLSRKPAQYLKAKGIIGKITPRNKTAILNADFCCDSRVNGRKIQKAANVQRMM